MPRLTAEQLAARKKGIGSSDIAEVLGIAPWEGASPVRLYAEKRGMFDSDEDDEPSEEQEIGHLLEPVLIKLYEEKSKNTVLPGGSVPHYIHPWAFASLDGKIMGVSAALEIKIVGIGMARHWDLLSDDGIPHYARVQVAWQMGCAALDNVHVTALITGTRHRVFYVKRDLQLEEMIFAAGADFWSRVARGEPPPLDASDGCREYLEKTYPAPPEPKIGAADEEIDAIGIERILAAAREKNAETTKKMLDAKLMGFMGEHGLTVLKAKTWRATWSQARKEGQKRRFVVTPLDLAAAATRSEEMPELDDGSPF